MNNLHIAGVNYESFVDGVGLRSTIYISGCVHRCPGCHNPETWDPLYGRLASAMIDEIAEEIASRSNLINGITLSGGDPFCSPREVSELLDRLPKVGNIWVYSGFKYEQIIDSMEMQILLSKIDVLVDGPFVEALKDPTLAFRGSSNQRIIDVQESINSDNVVLYNI